MVKPILLLIGAIPVVVAALIVIPMLTQPEIPYTAAVANDKIEIEYTKHQLRTVSFGVTERVAAERTEILAIDNDGKIKYTLTSGGVTEPDKFSQIDEEKLRKLTAIIKETGFMEIPSESFPIREDVTEFQKSNLKITLNDDTRQIYWPEQNATDNFVPPIITMVESELDQIINQLIE